MEDVQVLVQGVPHLLSRVLQDDDLQDNVHGWYQLAATAKN